MDRLRLVVVASAVTLSLVGVGHAADIATLPPPISMSPPTPEYVRRNVFNSDWYLRYDIGERWGFLTGATTPPGIGDPTDNSLGTGAVFGIGAGFRTNWVRSDVTVDSSAAQTYKGTIATTDDVTAKVQTVSALLNVYADLGTWYRLTPYIGAGIGAARVKVSDFNSVITPPYSGEASQWNMAWAAMAGAALAISQNLQLDLGYRYLNVGNVDSIDRLGGHVTFKNVGAHELRVGLRWNLDDLPGNHWNISDVSGTR